MQHAKQYIEMCDSIRSAAESQRPALKLHGLAVEISNSVFTEDEKKSLRGQIADAFGRLNAPTRQAYPHGRHTLLPRAGASLTRSAACLVFSFFIFHFSFTAFAAIPTDLAVNAIIGEAGNQKFATQLDVACAIRNRGTLQGVYGVNNPVVKQASARVRARALRAWKLAALRDLTGGLKNFGCDADAPVLLAYGLRPVFKSGDITFWQ